MSGGVRGDLSDSQNTENFLQSPKDRNFRPTDFEIGGDGALYVSDWQNIIIGHMQHNVRDPSRDHEYGRVYRVTHEGRPLMKHIKVDGEPISKLLDLLKERTNLTRHRARIELSERETSAVMSELAKWVKQWNPKKAEHAHHLMEALWLHQQHNVKNKKLLGQMLGSPNADARVAAATVKQFWATTASAKNETSRRETHREKEIGYPLKHQGSHHDPDCDHRREDEVRHAGTHRESGQEDQAHLCQPGPDAPQHRTG